MSGFRFCMAGSLFLSTWWLTILVTSVMAVEANSLPVQSEECASAQTKCSFRPGCFQALHSYMIDCADVLAGRTTKCPYACKKALISLTSSEAGLILSNCYCGDNEYCHQSKERIEVCRPEVSYATADNTIVSCSVAQWICAADSLCLTALDYYHRYCRSMFHGRKCSPRCNNSLSILNRQEKASKLRNCYCDGSEDFPCITIKQNTEWLCYGQEWENNELYLPSTTEVTFHSCSSRTSPSIVIYYLLICTVLLLSFRTSCEESDTLSYEGKINNIGTFHLSTGLQNSLRLSSRNRRWPWWWTSEKPAT